MTSKKAVIHIKVESIQDCIEVQTILGSCYRINWINQLSIFTPAASFPFYLTYTNILEGDKKWYLYWTPILDHDNLEEDCDKDCFFVFDDKSVREFLKISDAFYQCGVVSVDLLDVVEQIRKEINE